MKHMRLGLMILFLGWAVVGATGCDLQQTILDSAQGAAQLAIDDVIGGAIGGLLGQLPIPLG